MGAKLFDELEDMGAEVKETLERLGGDENLYIEYLYKLPGDPNIALLRKSVEEKDSKTAIRAVHTLKGVALNLGLLPLMDVCMDMLMDFRSGEIESAYAQLENIENVFNKWLEVINKYNKI